jgi:hypothetical protein
MRYLGDEYRIDELVAEVSKIILFILTGSVFTFIMLMFCLEAG